MRAVAALATLALAAADHQLQPPRPALARARLAPTSQQATKSCQSRLRLGRRENSSRARAVSSASRSAAGLSARGGATRVVAEPAFRGLRRDLRTFASTYGSHLRDGCSVKVLSAVCFLVFGCLAPAVGFGSLCGSVTEGAMGTMEMVLGTSVTGMAYALLAGQPLTIVGSTGPVLAFISALYRMAKAAEVPFLPLYAWTGLWASAILAVCAVFSLSNAVEFLSRFTDDIFANLISFIFIYEACRGLAGLVRSPQVPAEQALLGILLALMTVSVARTLQGLRSVNHVKALHEYERAHPGLLTSSKLEVCGTRENRLSGFLIHALIGATVVWFRPLLRSVPNAALSGLFLYLGLSALKGNQVQSPKTIT